MWTGSTRVISSDERSLLRVRSVSLKANTSSSAAWRKTLPRGNTFPEAIAYTYETIARFSSSSEKPAWELLGLVEELPDVLNSYQRRSQQERINWQLRRLLPTVGTSKRRHRTRRKKRGVMREERKAERLRTAALRYRRRHPDFDGKFAALTNVYLGPARAFAGVARAE